MIEQDKFHAQLSMKKKCCTTSKSGPRLAVFISHLLKILLSARKKFDAAVVYQYAGEGYT